MLNNESQPLNRNFLFTKIRYTTPDIFHLYRPLPRVRENPLGENTVTGETQQIRGESRKPLGKPLESVKHIELQSDYFAYFSLQDRHKSKYKLFTVTILM